MKKTDLLTLVTTLAMSLTFALSAKAQRQEPPEMNSEMKSAFEACAKEISLPDRESGVRPTKEQFDKMDACLSAKGFKKPEHRAHHDHKCDDEQSQQSENGSASE